MRSRLKNKNRGWRDLTPAGGGGSETFLGLQLLPNNQPKVALHSQSKSTFMVNASSNMVVFWSCHAFLAMRPAAPCVLLSHLALNSACHRHALCISHPPSALVAHGPLAALASAMRSAAVSRPSSALFAPGLPVVLAAAMCSAAACRPSSALVAPWLPATLCHRPVLCSGSSPFERPCRTRLFATLAAAICFAAPRRAPPCPLETPLLLATPDKRCASTKPYIPNRKAPLW